MQKTKIKIISTGVSEMGGFHLRGLQTAIYLNNKGARGEGGFWRYGVHETTEIDSKPLRYDRNVTINTSRL
jgi:hypothetical protein